MGLEHTNHRKYIKARPSQSQTTSVLKPSLGTKRAFFDKLACRTADKSTAIDQDSLICCSNFQSPNIGKGKPLQTH